MTTLEQRLVATSKAIKPVQTSVRFTGNHAELIARLALKYNVTEASVITSIVKDKLDNWKE